MQLDDARLSAQFASVSRRWPMRAYMMLNMPAAAFVGLRIDDVSREQTVISVPGGRRTQNPFGTMYWAVQGMAAELATGLIPNCISRSSSMKLRMFVVGTEGRFGRKAYGRCNFTCTDAYEKALAAFDESLDTRKSVNCDLTAVGTDAAGDVVSEWLFKWNFLASENG